MRGDRVSAKMSLQGFKDFKQKNNNKVSKFIWKINVGLNNLKLNH